MNQIWETASNDEFIEKIQKYAESVLPAQPARRRRSAGSSARCRSGAEIPFESALAIERELQQQLFQSEDAKEGLGAYVEKRKPNFSGK